MDILVDAFGNHNCMGKFGCIASFSPEQWAVIRQQVAQELLKGYWESKTDGAMLQYVEEIAAA